MQCCNRGAALINIIILLTILMTMAHILCEKVWLSNRRAIAEKSREQVFWAAQSGVEEARKMLETSYVASHNWQDYLVVSADHRYPPIPVWTMTIRGILVEIYLRDNPDGDGNYCSDNDLKIYVLSRAKGSNGAEAVVESLCGFNPISDGFMTSPTVITDLGAMDLTDSPITSFNILESL